MKYFGSIINKIKSIIKKEKVITRIMRGDQPLLIFQGKIYRRATIEERTDPETIDWDEDPIRLPSLIPSEFRAELFWTYRRMSGRLMAKVTTVRLRGAITHCVSKHGRSLHVIDGDIEDIQAEVYIDESQ